MSEPWNDYTAAPIQTDGPWSDYDMTGPNDKAPRLKKPSFGLGFREGFTKPFLNGAIAVEYGAQRLGIDTDRVNHFMGAKTAPELDDANRAAIANDPHSSPSAVGKIVGGVAGTAITLPVTKNPFVQGALQGALLTDSRNPVGVGMDAITGGGLNWFGGKALSGAADLVAPVIDPAVSRLANKGVKLTPGMLAGGTDDEARAAAMTTEDKRMSRPFVGDAIRGARVYTRDTWNVATMNEALAPLGVKVPSPMKASPETVDWAHRQVGAAYDQVIPHLSVQINGQQFAQNLMPVAQTLQPAQRKEFMRLMSLNLKNGQLQGQALKDAQGEIRRLASVYSRSPAAPDHLLGEALHAADDELSQAMMAQNPTYAPELQKVNKAYRGMMIVEDAAKRADESQFSTGQFKDAVKRGDRTKGQTATARGQAFMQDWSRDSRRVIPAQTPDSGTSGRNQASNLFAKLGGAADLGSWQTQQLLSKIALLPRPQQAAALAEFMRRIKGGGGSAAVATGEQSSN